MLRKKKPQHKHHKYSLKRKKKNPYKLTERLFKRRTRNYVRKQDGFRKTRSIFTVKNLVYGVNLCFVESLGGEAMLQVKRCEEIAKKLVEPCNIGSVNVEYLVYPLFKSKKKKQCGQQYTVCNFSYPNAECDFRSCSDKVDCGCGNEDGCSCTSEDETTAELCPSYTPNRRFQPQVDCLECSGVQYCVCSEKKVKKKKKQSCCSKNKPVIICRKSMTTVKPCHKSTQMKFINCDEKKKKSSCFKKKSICWCSQSPALCRAEKIVQTGPTRCYDNQYPRASEKRCKVTHKRSNTNIYAQECRLIDASMETLCKCNDVNFPCPHCAQNLKQNRKLKDRACATLVGDSGSLDSDISEEECCPCCKSVLNSKLKSNLNAWRLLNSNSNTNFNCKPIKRVTITPQLPTNKERKPFYSYSTRETQKSNKEKCICETDISLD